MKHGVHCLVDVDAKSSVR